VLDETLGLDAPQLAVLAVLELRGPQTLAELRVRTERMAAIESVDHELDLLAGREEPLVALVGRQPGQKEDRWSSLLAEPVSHRASDVEAPAAAPFAPGAAGNGPASGSPGRSERGLDALRADVEGLRRDVDAVRAELETLRSGLEDLRTSLGG
jgi:uncharacterized protein